MSQLFTRTLKEVSADEVAANARLLVRGGFVHKVMAGVYAYLPLGLRVLKKIEGIIREEMNALGAQELLLTALQDPAPWKKTGRWSDEAIDIWFKTQSGDVVVGLANTHEEPLTRMLTHHIASYKDLPFSAYQFQTKFRNEPRAKSGLLRAREFMMKDLYSFSRTAQEHEAFYEKAKDAYRTIFDRVGIGESTYITYASGGTFSAFSHEFQTVCEAGEDIIYIEEERRVAVNKEVASDDVLRELGLKRENLREAKAIEVGNIFSLGTRFSEPLELLYADEKGDKRPVIMGSYGIGPGRVIGTAVELRHDERGIRWPAAIAPYDAHVIMLDSKEREAEDLIARLEQEGIDALYDDRLEKQAGEKFADADLIGIPWRIVVSKRTVEKGMVEIKQRISKDSSLIEVQNVKIKMQNDNIKF